MSDEDSKAILLSALVGGILGVIVGYFAYAVSQAESVSFGYWISDLKDRGGIWWAIGGAVVGGLVGYIRSLERN